LSIGLDLSHGEAAEGALAPWHVELTPPVHSPEAVPRRLIQIEESSGALNRAVRLPRPEQVEEVLGILRLVAAEHRLEFLTVVAHDEPCVHQFGVEIR